MVDPRDYLDKARALAAMLPSDPFIKLHRRQCLCLQQKLAKTLELLVGRVASYNTAPIPAQYEEVFVEFHHLVQKVKTFVEDCCYENENDFVLAAIRVIAHKGKFFQYHVELDWCSFLVKCLWEADILHRKPVYSQTLQKFDWEQKFKSLFLDRREMIAADERKLKALLESWIAKPGEHQAICWALLRRFGSETESDLHTLPENPGFPPIPTSLRKFIGEGSYGYVQEMKWKETLFAVKHFPIHNVETINNEVKILEHCCHPHIVNLILAYKEDRTQYLMMERLSCDLESYIEKRKERGTISIPTSEAVDMISQICEGMLYLNDPERKVSHRDLKPRNILVKELKPVTDSEIPAIDLQVADFGVAKERKEKGPGKSSISENTPNCGTLLYRAPEMTGKPGGVKIRGSSMKADMYSFAVTCSFILTGTAPFSGYKNRESLKQAVKDGARPDLPKDCPPALATLLERCWNSDPTKRPESFSEILTELRKLKANLLTSAIVGVEPPGTEAPEVGVIEGVEPARRGELSVNTPLIRQSIKWILTFLIKAIFTAIPPHFLYHSLPIEPAQVPCGAGTEAPEVGAIEGVEPADTEAPEVGAIEGVEPAGTEAPEVGVIEGVEPAGTEAPEEPVVMFNPGDRRLNCLVLGDSESVEAVIGHLCGAGRRQIPVEGHVNLRECRISLPPMCLYSHTQGINRNYFTDIRTFVKVRNKKWRPTEVVPLCVNEVHDFGPRNRPALFPDSTLRLHMVWFVCRKLSDLPNLLQWPEITKKLCDLPVQILVIEKQSVQQEFNIIFENGSDYFPGVSKKFMEKLILKVDLKDDDLKGKLWRACWAVKTRVEIGNTARIIRNIQKHFEPARISDKNGVGGARLGKDVALSRSGEFVLIFLCAYWDIPQDSLRRVLQRTTTFTVHARGSKFSIERGKFVEFCLKVAAIILYNARDNAKNPKYVCSWNVSSESSLDQLLQTEARECYNSYFACSNPLDYGKFEDIRLFLESIFEREGWDPRPHRESFISKIKNQIYTRGKSVRA